MQECSPRRPFIVRNLYFILLNAWQPKRQTIIECQKCENGYFFRFEMCMNICCRYLFRGNFFSMIFAMGEETKLVDGYSFRLDRSHQFMVNLSFSVLRCGRKHPLSVSNHVPVPIRTNVICIGRQWYYGFWRRILPCDRNDSDVCAMSENYPVLWITTCSQDFAKQRSQYW